MSADEQEDSAQTTPYQEAGELAGITRLVDEFYVNMDTLPEAETIRNMHPEDLTESRKKLTYFLSGWLGGPKLFQQHYGPISIPRIPQTVSHRVRRTRCLAALHATSHRRPAV